MKSEENKEAHVAELLKEALLAGLQGAEWASRQGCRWLTEAYNGIGPEFLGESPRRWATRLLATFEPAALIHDARNHVSDGTKEGFLAANTEFLFNCLRLADRKYGWWSWKRYFARSVALAMHDFVSGKLGWLAWQEAHERKVKRLKG